MWWRKRGGRVTQKGWEGGAKGEGVNVVAQQGWEGDAKELTRR